LQQQLSEVQAENVQAHIQLNIAAFQLNSAADPSVIFQPILEQKNTHTY
jgi:hypothetical protein